MAVKEKLKVSDFLTKKGQEDKARVKLVKDLIAQAEKENYYSLFKNLLN